VSITDQVQQDMVTALKAGDKQLVAALRMLLSPLQLGEKEASGEFGEQQEIAVLMSEKKKRQQAAEAFRSGGANDRAEKEEAEVAIIEKYLPQALGQAELEAMVDEAIASTGAAGPKDMGKVMSALMPKVAGRADGKALSALVMGRLQG